MPRPQSIFSYSNIRDLFIYYSDKWYLSYCVDKLVIFAGKYDFTDYFDNIKTIYGDLKG